MWDYVSLGDIDAIKGLIIFRDKLDQFYGIKNEQTSEVEDMNISLILLYTHLDSLIDSCNFNQMQLLIINLLNRGYTFNEIDKIPIFLSSNISSRAEFNLICKDIQYHHDKEWDIWINKKFLNVGFKECAYCHEVLPVNNKYFGKDNRNKDGLRSYCKQCERVKKRKF